MISTLESTAAAKAAKKTGPGMMLEFQVFYLANGRLEFVAVRAQTADEARRLIETPTFPVHSVGPGLPTIEPGQNVFTREEAAVYLRCSPSKIDDLMAKGKLPKAKEGRPMFTRRMLEEVLMKRMGVASE